MTTTTSTQFRVNWNDIFKGLITAVLSPVFVIIITSLEAGNLDFDWRVIKIVALSAGLGYIMKNFLTPAKIIVAASKETVEAVKDGVADVKVITTP